LGFMVIVLQVYWNGLEFLLDGLLLMLPVFGGPFLVSSGNLSIWSFYEFQPSDFCTLELGIVQSLHGFCSQVQRI
jgi:hypothetical protein